MAVAAAVFSTVELLEEILLSLDFADLVRTTAVCKTFRATIEGSKKLQEALFLRPGRESGLFLGERHRVSPEIVGREGDSANCRLLAFTPSSRDRRDLPIVSCNPAWAERGNPRDLKKHTIDLNQLLRCRSPWLKMFLTQPPTKHVTIGFDPATVSQPNNSDSHLWTESWCYGSVNIKIRRWNGVRLLDIVECVSDRAWLRKSVILDHSFDGRDEGLWDGEGILKIADSVIQSSPVVQDAKLWSEAGEDAERWKAVGWEHYQPV